MFGVAPLVLMLILATSTAVDAVGFKQETLDAVMEKIFGSNRDLVPQKRSAAEMERTENTTATCSDDRILQLFSRLSLQCQNYLFEAVTDYDFEAESAVMCQSCGAPLYSILECLDSTPDEMGLFDVLCAENENGDTCYSLLSGNGAEEAEVFAKCGDMNCPDECRRKLQESYADYGCCLYSLVALNDSVDAARDMWRSCGLPEPLTCSGFFFDGGSGGGGVISQPTADTVDIEALPTIGIDEEEEEEEMVTDELLITTSTPTAQGTNATARETPAETEPTSTESPPPTTTQTTTTTATTTEVRVTGVDDSTAVKSENTRPRPPPTTAGADADSALAGSAVRASVGACFALSLAVSIVISART